MVHHTTALQQLNDRQSRFVADLTHELKTPLTSMIGYADLLRGGELPPENQRRTADAIYHESTRLESLSQQLLSLQDLRQEALTLTAVPVAAACEDVARSLPDCPVTLEKTCPEDAAVRADRVLLADLLRNLVLNAAHASAPGSTVTLRCLPAGDRWRLEVADTGCGIPPEALPHLTEPLPGGQGPGPGQRRQRRGAGPLRRHCRRLWRQAGIYQHRGRRHHRRPDPAQGGVRS